MEFSESGSEWRPMPWWADFLINFGYRWVQASTGSRRIGVLSMPSESPAAGLVALGAMRRHLEMDDANDVDAHFRRLNELARRCRDVELKHPQENRRWRLDVDSTGRLWARHLTKRGYSKSISRDSASQWRLADEPPVAVSATTSAWQAIPNGDLYERLILRGDRVRPSNLTATDSGVCLASSLAGGANTRSRMDDVRLRANGESAALSEMLTVRDWVPGTVSRVRFFNARTEQFDRDPRPPKLAVADGDGCFLRLLNLEQFEEVDLIGVVHRTLDRDRLEALGNRLGSLTSSWYQLDAEMLANFGEVPSAISVTALRRT